MTDIGKVIKQQRVMSGLTIRQLSDKSGVSSSHLGRIERGERFPSASILRKIAKPLGFDKQSIAKSIAKEIVEGKGGDPEGGEIMR